MKKQKFTKKLASIVVICVFALALAGCSSETSSTESEPAEAAETEKETETEKEPVVETKIKETEPEEEEPKEPEEPTPQEVDVSNLSKDQSNMLAPMDCYSTVINDSYSSYDEIDHDEAWEALYLIIVNYTDVFGNKVTQDLQSNDLVVSADTLIDCAYAMFDGFDGTLPEDGYGENINREGDTYYFMNSDRGDSYTRISAWTDEGDGTCTVETEVLSESEQELYATYSFILGPNAHAEEETSPLFTYTVIGMEKLD